MTAVERQDREEVDHRERERDHREQEQRAVGAEVDRLARRLVRPDDARDLLALLGVEDAGDVILIMAVISMSLEIVNLFPFLPLDGGHIFWALAEKLRGRAIPFSVMERAGFVGFALVIALFMVGLTNDIGRRTGEGITVR